MTLPLNSRLSALYDTNGTQKDFSFGFRVFFDPDNGGYGLEVRRQTADGYEVIPKSDYLVLPVEDNSAGVVRFSVAPSAGQQIYIAGKTPTIQQLVLTNFGRYSAESIETQFDFITAIIQEWLSALGEETRQRIAADDILTQYVVQRIDDFVQQVNQNWDDKSQELESYIATIMPSFTQTLRDEIEEFAAAGMQDAIDQTLAESKAEIDDAVARANAAALAAAITGKVYDTPEAGVDPVTGVGNGSYYNVRSSSDESYIDEYQNFGGVPTPSGKSYPSAAYVQKIAKQNIATIAELKQADTGQGIVNVSGSLYEWQPDNSTAVDDAYFVQSNHSTTGRWVNLVRSLKSSIKPDLAGVFRGYRKLELIDLYNVGDTLPLGQDYLKVEGYGEATGFTWVGGDGSAQTDLAQLKPILAVKKSSIANAVSGIKLIDFCVDVADVKNVCAVDSRFITNNSKVEGIRVKNIGINSVGYYISKQWYARFTDCYALGRWQNNKEGVGVYVDTRTPETGISNQVNSITLDISCRDLKYGYLIDPSRYIYSLIIPAGVTIEKCAVGIKVVSATLPVTIRNGVITAYFEKNDIDVEWGDISDTRVLGQKITWLNCSFEDTGSKVILNQGQHIFIGCSGLETLVVNNSATVKLDNTYVDIIQNNTGNSRNVLNLREPNSVAGSSRYSDQSARPLRSTSVGINLGSGEGAKPVTIDLLNADTGIFTSANIPYQGRKARIFAIMQRSYDTTTAFTWQGTVLQKSSGWYLIPDPTSVTGTATDPKTSEVVGNVTADRAWTITASIDNAGVLTLSSQGTDTKYYDVTVTAM